ncbi:cardiolipin synthase [Velocimicrobium porci]|uniref:Cardiolipin synthase n=1 Tax=Velocimicrobium porci TaxID=2606634 RepID=A0A6L5XYA9_9FIRM|nr:cardiolipin synthase [Velocimicrobium porci]MSS63441.1 cardiolipin synthase [Velocimicrobium porci]
MSNGKIEKGKKGLFQLIYGRTLIVILMILMQVGLLIAFYQFLQGYVIYVYGASIALAAVVLLHIINDETNPTYKMVWIIPILVVPLFGVLLYLYTHLQIEIRLLTKRHAGLIKETRIFLEQEKEVLEDLEKEDTHVASTAKYLCEYGGYPAYINSRVKYFPLGEDKFEEMKIQLKKAKHFIFMEYFIIQEGYMWNSVLEILEEKVKEGVEVRVMYDGMCCMVLLPYHYPDELKKKGIKCKMFSPIVPALSTYQNNRDHRKILVIDGFTAFTGGVNLADEYINKKERFGHWKDTAVMIQGDAVKSFTLMFLQMWNITEKQPENYMQYVHWCEKRKGEVLEDGYVIPYADSPLDKENVGEQVYFDIIHQACSYVHIMTPYLILDNEMMVALTHAAKRGVDTVIIMPHIPDKVYAFWLAKTYYKELLEAGVKIYEYTPGFVHAKVFVSDDEKAVVGSINLDFRSLYLHFECASYFYKNSEIFQMERDFQNTLKKCQEITLEDCKKQPALQRICGSVLRLIAPLM